MDVEIWISLILTIIKLRTSVKTVPLIVILLKITLDQFNQIMIARNAMEVI
jgi:hypothetical protein